jgi:hypothetical protein
VHAATVDPVVVSKATKHKDLRMISKYAHADEETKMVTPTVVALAGGEGKKRKYDGELFKWCLLWLIFLTWCVINHRVCWES